jgi:hypothetical protein
MQLLIQVFSLQQVHFSYIYQAAGGLSTLLSRFGAYGMVAAGVVTAGGLMLICLLKQVRQ